ncbi:MAG: phosphate signaling complex protein PhoU [Ignavibacteria bacterium]|nr:phosphate signaling complex protein PhoU [Ignavibacteria bacterium]MBP6510749.1 phosphate signaling complex protein PhoU [Candidatus Kapabacteria bacterium]MBK6420132.1 phosphate signaling complex protein PhoU [Ignavibacteria bacterium]MBK7034328.1 phosphate signaling complex protein PhoU [Ignavibacteria bacterium]MBK7184960.1 phosphate signaling complex protein PhoU [Ignavibacteria bacterium]
MNRTFEEDLDKLRTRLIRMGSLVEEQVEFALRALREGNQELATIVMDRDDKVDKLDLKIDKQCQRIFALNQPVATDLRLLLAAMKINNELERIGDMATNIASIVVVSPNAVQLANQIDMNRIANAAYTMLKSSLDAFINNDPELAAHVLPSDFTVDQLYDTLRNELIEIMIADSTLVADGAQLLLGLYNLERMADHATNIAENVIFLAEAKLVRHRSVNDEGLASND